MCVFLCVRSQWSSIYILHNTWKLYHEVFMYFLLGSGGEGRGGEGGGGCGEVRRGEGAPKRQHKTTFNHI